MNAVTVFQFERDQVRSGVVGGATVFVTQDVCEVLGIAKYRDAVRQLDLDERVSVGVDTLGGVQQVSAVTEAGVYSLALISRSPRVKPFMRWLTHEVVPEIRKTGSYNVPAPTESRDQLIARALVEASGLLAEKDERIAELEPRADAWNAIASAEGDYSVGDAAKMLMRSGIPTGPTRLFGQLSDIRWTYRGQGGAWRAYAERVEKGYLAERPQFHYHPKTGEKVLDEPQVRVTLKGIDRLRQRLHVGGLKAVSA